MQAHSAHRGCRRTLFRRFSVFRRQFVQEWGGIKAPPPALKPTQVDAKTTAVLMLDFMNQNCGNRPRPVGTIPAVKKLLSAARAAKTSVVYSIIANSTSTK